MDVRDSKQRGGSWGEIKDAKQDSGSRELCIDICKSQEESRVARQRPRWLLEALQNRFDKQAHYQRGTVAWVVDGYDAQTLWKTPNQCFF